MKQIEKNKAELWSDIRDLANAPLNASRSALLVESMAAYDALCRVAKYADEQNTDEDTEDFEDDADPAFNSQMAAEWTKGMENEDGTHGPHWTMEQTDKVMSQRGVKCDPVQFWVTMNMIYSDYCRVFQKYGVGDKIDFYADMAKAFLDDKDAMPDKLARYYAYIVQK